MSFDLLIKRYFSLLLLGLVAVIAYFQAMGTMQLIGASLTAPAGFAAWVPSSIASTGMPIEPKPPRLATAILARNAFDSVTGPVTAAARPVGSVAQSGDRSLSNPVTAPLCNSMKALIITESADPVWSVAAIQAPGEATTKLYRVGDDVAGKQVAYIGYNPWHQSPAAWLVDGAALCQVLLFSSSAPPLPSSNSSALAATAEPYGPNGVAGAPGVGPSSPRPPDAAAPVVSKVQRISENEYHVDRSVVTGLLADQAELMKSARVMPETKDGRVLGLRLIGVRPETLLGVLGIQSGDRLETINGFDMASPEKALEAYMRLKSADSLSVQITRRGQPLTIRYRID